MGRGYACRSVKVNRRSGTGDRSDDRQADPTSSKRGGWKERQTVLRDGWPIVSNRVTDGHADRCRGRHGRIWRSVRGSSGKETTIGEPIGAGAGKKELTIGATVGVALFGLGAGE